MPSPALLIEAMRRRPTFANHNHQQSLLQGIWVMMIEHLNQFQVKVNLSHASTDGQKLLQQMRDRKTSRKAELAEYMQERSQDSVGKKAEKEAQREANDNVRSARFYNDTPRHPSPAPPFPELVAATVIATATASFPVVSASQQRWWHDHAAQTLRDVPTEARGADADEWYHHSEWGCFSAAVEVQSHWYPSHPICTPKGCRAYCYQWEGWVVRGYIGDTNRSLNAWYLWHRSAIFNNVSRRWLVGVILAWNRELKFRWNISDRVIHIPSPLITPRNSKRTTPPCPPPIRRKRTIDYNAIQTPTKCPRLITKTRLPASRFQTRLVEVLEIPSLQDSRIDSNTNLRKPLDINYEISVICHYDYEQIWQKWKFSSEWTFCNWIIKYLFHCEISWSQKCYLRSESVF